MTDPTHAIVWLDHRDAKVFRFSTTDGGPLVLHSNETGHHLQHKANVPGSGHQGVDTEYFGRVVDSLADFDAILLTGPGTAHLELKHYIEEHRPGIVAQIKAVEALDHPSDAQLLELGRRCFHIVDRNQA